MELGALISGQVVGMETTHKQHVSLELTITNFLYSQKYNKLHRAISNIRVRSRNGAYSVHLLSSLSLMYHHAAPPPSSDAQSRDKAALLLAVLTTSRKQTVVGGNGPYDPP